MRERERPREQDLPERREPPAPLDPLLAAGNHAVARFLARQPKPKEKPKEAPAEGRRVVFPGIGTIPIEAIQMDAGRPVGTPNTGDREGGAAPPGDLHVTSKTGSHSSELFKASSDGRVADLEIHLPGGDGTVVMYVTAAIVAAYRPGTGEDGFESWTLNARAIEYVRTDREEKE
jgi:hypothetical protein